MNRERNLYLFNFLKIDLLDELLRDRHFIGGHTSTPLKLPTGMTLEDKKNT